MLLQGRGQATNELLTEDNQRINQISALLSGGQVSQPNFQSGVGITPAATTDNAAIIGNYDNARMNQWQQNQASAGSFLGGLGGLFSGGADSAASGIGRLLTGSDENMKTDKKKIAETKDGMGIYQFKYKGSPRTEIGLMAQEVRKTKPGAVHKRPDGMLMVNYGEALK